MAESHYVIHPRGRSESCPLILGSFPDQLILKNDSGISGTPAGPETVSPRPQYAGYRFSRSLLPLPVALGMQWIHPPVGSSDSLADDASADITDSISGPPAASGPAAQPSEQLIPLEFGLPTPFMLSLDLKPKAGAFHIKFPASGVWSPPDFLIWDGSCQRCLHEGLPERMVYQRDRDLGENDYEPLYYHPQHPEGVSRKWLFLPDSSIIEGALMAWPHSSLQTCTHQTTTIKTALPPSGLSHKQKQFALKRQRFDRVKLGLMPFEALTLANQREYRGLATPWVVSDESQYADEMLALRMNNVNTNGSAF